jgi:hydroxypyruvate isomerase
VTKTSTRSRERFGNQRAYLEGLRSSVKTAARFGAPVLIVQAGGEISRISRQDQKTALIETLALAGELLEGSGVRIGLEPLNTLVDHPGYFLSSTKEALEIVTATGRQEIGIVYDVYHSAVMGEETEVAIGANVDRVFHLHVADYPGRHEPGTGSIDFRKRLNWLSAQGYRGFLGLEYKPTLATRASIARCQDLLRQNGLI